MLYNIFLLVIIIILLSIKIYKNKDEFEDNLCEINNFLDKNAVVVGSEESCAEQCENTENQPCFAYQHVDTTLDGINKCRISKTEITHTNLVSTTLNDSLHIIDCNKPTQAVNPCDDGGIEKARRNKLKNICVSKTFNPDDCPTLKTLCDDLQPPCP